jgi:hypothetical protein
VYVWDWSLLKNYEVSQLLTSGGTRSTRKRKWALEFYHHFWRGTIKRKWAPEFYHHFLAVDQKESDLDRLWMCIWHHP